MSKPKKSPQINRSQARSLAFQILYSLEFYKIKSLQDLKEAYTSTPRVSIYSQKNVAEYELNDDELTGENAQLPSINSIPMQDDDVIEDMPIAPLLPEGFTWELVEGVWTYLSELDDTIKAYAKNWRLDRLGRIELTILRIALYEMLYRDDIPVKVSIAEALELTNKFAEYKAHSFVNGLLDAVHKNVLIEEKQDKK